VKRSDVLRFHPPGLMDQRGERHLLVWGDLARWLVVDAELLSMLQRFNGKRAVKAVLRKHASKWSRPEGDVESEAFPVLAQMARKGILRRDSRPVKLTLEPISIANLTLNITNRCNLNCPFCYNDSRRSEDADVAALMAAVTAAPELFSPEATFILLGGEPFLTPDRTFHAIEATNTQFKAPALVSTNGTLINDDVVAHLAKLNVEVQVSLDAPDQRTHDAGRGRGIYDRALAGIGKLVEAGVPVILSMVYNARNLDDFEPYLDLAQKLGAREARFIPLRQIGGGLSMRNDAPNQRRAFDQLLDVLERRPELSHLLGRDYFSIAMAMCRFTLPRSGCGIGRQVLFIDADGTVYPCPNHVHPELATGNVLEQSLAHIMHQSHVMNAMRKQYRIDRYHECRDCPFRGWCAGDCRGEALAVTGDPLAPSPHCAELKKLFLEVLWLLAANDQRLGANQVSHGQDVDSIWRQ
jgi:radical SAM protein with 4Fe4S-binding SPASM domain